MENKKLNVLNIIKNAIRLYSENFKILLSLSILTMLVAKVSGFLLGTPHMPFMLIFERTQFLVQIVLIVLAYVGIFYSTRISVASQLASSEFYYGRPASIGESYKNAKGYAWKVIFTMFLLMIIIVIPAFIFRLGITSEYPIFIRALLLIIGGVVTVILGVKFGLAPIIRVLAPEEKNYFKYSNELVNGSFIEVMILFGIAFMIFPINFIINSIIASIAIGATSSLILQILQISLSILFEPFRVLITVLIFTNLSNRQHNAERIIK